MSIESAKLFIEKVNTNLEFSNKVMEIEGIELLMEFIVKEGFDFTGKELKEADVDFGEGDNQELFDNDLGVVTGGIMCIYPPCTNSSTSAYCVAKR